LKSFTNESNYNVDDMFNLNIKLKGELQTLVDMLELQLNRINEKKQQKLSEQLKVKAENQERQMMQQAQLVKNMKL
jgi:hypothetical protein